MLEHTFLHLHGVGQKTEELFWQEGIVSWEGLQAASQRMLLPGRRRLCNVEGQLARSRENLEQGDARYFTALLSSRDKWRLFAQFRQQTAYLDIETTGLGRDQDHITTISLYDGQRVRCYIWGENLRKFVDDIRDYRVLITFNGECFDLPFIERQFNIRLDQAHLDLRFILAGLGYRGGLKRCEKQLGIERGLLEDVDGYTAVLLWQEYRRSGDPRLLETLLAYNVEDTINLELLACLAYNEAIAATPFAGERLTLPQRSCTLPYQPHPEVLARLLGQGGRRPYWGKGTG